MHAENAELADERVHHDLEHVGEHMLFGIGLRMEFDCSVALAFGEQRRIPFRRIGQQLDEDVEQLLHAGAVLGRNKAHRNQVAVAQRFLERRVQLVRFNLALFQVQRHQLLVDLHHLIDQRAMRVSDRREIGFAGTD